MLATRSHRPPPVARPAASTLARAVLGVLAIPGLLAGPSAALAQEEPAENPGNFVHPAATETVPLGELGHVEVRGSGAVPLVLIPGASFEWDVWDGFMERNAERYTMLAVTPAGNGDTKPPPMPENPEDFTDHAWTDALVQAIGERVRAEGLDRPVVVGHHLLGDHYAMRLGLEHPDTFRAVVVVAGTPSRVSPGRDGSIDDQIAAVEEQWKPFFRDVTWERWLQGTYKAEQFSVDPERGERLYEAQISTPLPTQLRYFLEYLTTNIAPDLSDLQVPMLVVNQSPDFDAMRESWAKSAEEQMGSLEVARERVDQQLVDTYGSLEEAERRLARPWELIEDEVPRLRVEYVDDSGLFIMQDRREAFDELLWEFIRGISTER